MKEVFSPASPYGRLDFLGSIPAIRCGRRAACCARHPPPSHQPPTLMASDTHTPPSAPQQPRTKKAASPTKQPAKRKTARISTAPAASSRSRRRTAVVSTSQVDLSAETLPPTDALPSELKPPSDSAAGPKEHEALPMAPVQAEAEPPLCEGATLVDVRAQANAEPLANDAPTPAPKFYLRLQEAGFGPYTAFQLCGGLRLGIFKTSDQVLEAGGSNWQQISQVLPNDDELSAGSAHTILTLPPRPHTLTNHAPAPPPQLAVPAAREPVADREVPAPSIAAPQGERESDASSFQAVSVERGWSHKKRILTAVLASVVLVGAVMLVLALRLA